eukprot:1909190-Alexandrium_andersonii.AAC.1
MSASLVGSEMCIRDRRFRRPAVSARAAKFLARRRPQTALAWRRRGTRTCLLYTSDAADDM